MLISAKEGRAQIDQTLGGLLHPEEALSGGRTDVLLVVLLLSRPRVPVASVVPHNGNRVCSSREQVWVQYPRTGGPWARTSGVAPLVHISKSWAFLPAWPWASDASSAKDSSLSRLSRRSETVCPPNVQGLGLVQTSAACSAKSSRVRLWPRSARTPQSPAHKLFIPALLLKIEEARERIVVGLRGSCRPCDRWGTWRRNPLS